MKRQPLHQSQRCLRSNCECFAPILRYGTTPRRTASPSSQKIQTSRIWLFFAGIRQKWFNCDLATAQPNLSPRRCARCPSSSIPLIRMQPNLSWCYLELRWWDHSSTKSPRRTRPNLLPRGWWILARVDSWCYGVRGLIPLKRATPSWRQILSSPSAPPALLPKTLRNDCKQMAWGFPLKRLTPGRDY